MQQPYASKRPSFIYGRIVIPITDKKIFLPNSQLGALWETQ